MKNIMSLSNIDWHKPLLSLSAVVLWLFIQPINLNATIPHKQSIDPIEHAQQVTDTEPIDNASATVPATYKKGMPAFFAFIRDNIVYPKSLLKENVQGAVVVRFVVNAKGKVSDAWIIKSVHPEMDKEAIRVVKKLGKFSPAKLNGKKTPVFFTLPIRFSVSRE